EVFRNKFQLQGAHLSPDNRFMSYVSNESGRNEGYVRPFNTTVAANAAPAKGPSQISDQGAQGMAVWRKEGKELYYVAADRGLMAVAVSTSADFGIGKPQMTIRSPETNPVGAGWLTIPPECGQV